MSRQISCTYPGHPVVIAYLITEKFSSYPEAAFQPEKGVYPNALTSKEIPGAGSHVWAALELLQFLRSGVSWEAAIQHTDNFWQSVTQNAYADCQAPGQREADEVKPILKAKERWWLSC